MKTKFQIALENNEPSEFFKGQGQYFSRDPDWGNHLYINNWQGVCGYLKSKDNSNKILLEAFSKYLTSLRSSYEDADSLLLNISCYFLIRNDTSFMSENRFDLIASLIERNKKTIGELFRLLRREYANQNAGKPVISLDQFLSQIKANGCRFDLEKF